MPWLDPNQLCLLALTLDLSLTFDTDIDSAAITLSGTSETYRRSSAEQSFAHGNMSNVCFRGTAAGIRAEEKRRAERVWLVKTTKPYHNRRPSRVYGPMPEQSRMRRVVIMVHWFCFHLGCSVSSYSISYPVIKSLQSTCGSLIPAGRVFTSSIVS